MNAIYYGGLLSFARLYAMGVIGRLNGWKRYERDTYSEVDIGALPPGEVMQMGKILLITSYKKCNSTNQIKDLAIYSIIATIKFTI